MESRKTTTSLMYEQLQIVWQQIVSITQQHYVVFQILGEEFLSNLHSSHSVKI